MRTALAPFHRSRLVGALLGPTIRPPVAVLYRYRLRIDDTLEEYVTDARRHPLFELHPKDRCHRGESRGHLGQRKSGLPRG
jgi:hypothetical protein